SSKNYGASVTLKELIRTSVQILLVYHLVHVVEKLRRICHVKRAYTHFCANFACVSSCTRRRKVTAHLSR
ncbi:MAG: hypothetical protein IJ532_01520, partial [Alphaproteobacteria bacterium]|nr:hypothetical protein [Alphaproteobacteria bacterium]